MNTLFPVNAASLSYSRAIIAFFYPLVHCTGRKNGKKKTDRAKLLLIRRVTFRTLTRLLESIISGSGIVARILTAKPPPPAEYDE